MLIDSFTSVYSRPIGSGSFQDFSGFVSHPENLDDNFYVGPGAGDGLREDLPIQGLQNYKISWQFNPVNYNGLCEQIKIHFNCRFRFGFSISDGIFLNAGQTSGLPVMWFWKLNNTWNSGQMNVGYYGDYNVAASSLPLFEWNTFTINEKVPSGYFNNFEIGFLPLGKNLLALYSPPEGNNVASGWNINSTENFEAIYVEVSAGNLFPMYVNGGDPANAPSKNIPLYQLGNTKLSDGVNLSVFDYGDGGYWPPVNSSNFIYNYSTKNTTPIPFEVPGANKYNDWSNIGTYNNGKSANRWTNGNTNVGNMALSPANSIIVPLDGLNGSKQSYPLFNVPQFDGYAKNIKVKIVAAFYDCINELVNSSPYTECPFGPHEKRGWVELVNYPKQSGVFSDDPLNIGAGDPLSYTGYKASYNAYFEDIYGYSRTCGTQVPNLENYTAVNNWKEYTIELSELNQYKITWDDFTNLQLGFYFDDVNLSNIEDPTIRRNLHAYSNYLGFGRIKSAQISFEIPTMPFYIEGGTWETLTVPLFGFCNDGNAQLSIPSYIEGNGFPASGSIPIWMSGLPNESLQVPVYMHNFTTFDSGISIYTSGMYNSNLQVPLYAMSSVNLDSGVPLFSPGIPAANLSVPTYITGPTPINYGLNTYIAGPVPIDSGFGLFSYNQFGESASENGVGLYTQSAYFANQGLDLQFPSVAYNYNFLWDSLSTVTDIEAQLGPINSSGFYNSFTRFIKTGMYPPPNATGIFAAIVPPDVFLDEGFTDIPGSVNSTTNYYIPPGSWEKGTILWEDWKIEDNFGNSRGTNNYIKYNGYNGTYKNVVPILDSNYNNIFIEYLKSIDPYNILNSSGLIKDFIRDLTGGFLNVPKDNYWYTNTNSIRSQTISQWYSFFDVGSITNPILISPNTYARGDRSFTIVKNNVYPQGLNVVYNPFLNQMLDNPSKKYYKDITFENQWSNSAYNLFGTPVYTNGILFFGNRLPLYYYRGVNETQLVTGSITGVPPSYPYNLSSPATNTDILVYLTNYVQYYLNQAKSNRVSKPFFSAYINGLYYNGSGKVPLYINTSYDGLSSSFNLDDSIGLYIKQIGISNIKDTTLYVHNVGEVYSQNNYRSLYIHSPDPIYTINSSFGMVLKNSVSGINMGAPLYTQYLRDISIFDPLYFELDDNAIPLAQSKSLMIYNNAYDDSIPMFVKVLDIAQSGLSVYLEGTNNYNSGIPLMTKGLGNLTDATSIYTHGF